MNKKTLIPLLFLLIASSALLTADGTDDPLSDDLFDLSSDALFADLEGSEPAFSEGGESTDEAVNPFEDFDALFSEEQQTITEIYEVSSGDTETYEQFLITEGIDWSGRFSGSVDFGLNWSNYTEGIDLKDYGTSFSPSISSTLSFDARPEVDYRVFGKFLLETGSDDSSGLGTISVRELFADFQHNDRLFFRIGKSFVKWGVGYFFSPADIVNLDAINAEDPTAERQGPLNLRVQYPMGANNLYLYLFAEGITEPADLLYAGKYEWVMGRSEFGLGSIVSGNTAPKLMSTVSTAIGEINWFGEAVLSYGSDRTFVTAPDTPTGLPISLDTYTVDDKLFFKGTIGFSWINEDPGIMFIGQYYYNGEGYSDYAYEGYDRTLLDDAAFTYNPLKPESSALSLGDLISFGRHYGAVSASLTSLFGSDDLGLSLFWIGNLTDGSGIIAPTLSWSPIDRITTSVGFHATYGASGTEYADPMALLMQGVQEPTLSLTFGVSLGGGRF